MGRGVIIKLAVILVFVYILGKERAPERISRIKKSAIFVIAIAAVVVVATTLIRFNSVMNEAGDVIKENYAQLFLQPFVEYFYVPIQAFDYGFEHIFHYGFPFVVAADLAGIIDFFLLFA